MAVGATFAKEEKVLVHVPGPYENDFHNLLLYIGYAAAAVFLFFCVAIVCSLEIRKGLRVACCMLKKKLVKASNRIAPGLGLRETGQSAGGRPGKVGGFEASPVEVVDGVPAQAVRALSQGGLTGSMATIHPDNELQKHINENVEQIQANTEKAARLRRMAQVLQDINKAAPDTDGDKLSRLDKEFKIHEDLLALEKENEALARQNEALARKLSEEAETPEFHQEDGSDPQDITAKVIIEQDQEKQADAPGSQRALLRSLQQSSWRSEHEHPGQDCQPEYAGEDPLPPGQAESTAPQDEAEEDQMPRKRPHFLLIYCGVFCGCYCCVLAIIALAASYINPELAYSVDVDLCLEVPRE